MPKNLPKEITEDFLKINDIHDVNNSINYQSDNQDLNLTWFVVAVVYSVVIWIFCRSVRRYTTTSI